MKKFKLIPVLGLMFQLIVACGDNSTNSSSVKATSSKSTVAKSGYALKSEAKVQVDASKFNKSKYQKGEHLNYSSVSPLAVALSRDIKCSSDGRFCFECYYKSNGELLYCDIWTLPPLSTK